MDSASSSGESSVQVLSISVYGSAGTEALVVTFSLGYARYKTNPSSLARDGLVAGTRTVSQSPAEQLQHSPTSKRWGDRAIGAMVSALQPTDCNHHHHSWWERWRTQR